jgi:hypothetical protein
MRNTTRRPRENRTITIDFRNEGTYLGFQEHLPDNGTCCIIGYLLLGPQVTLYDHTARGSGDQPWP